MKICSKCKIEKEDSEFYSPKRSSCKLCHRVYQRKYTLAWKESEKGRIYEKEYRKKRTNKVMRPIAVDI